MSHPLRENLEVAGEALTRFVRDVEATENLSIFHTEVA